MANTLALQLLPPRSTSPLQSKLLLSPPNRGSSEAAVVHAGVNLRTYNVVMPTWRSCGWPLKPGNFCRKFLQGGAQQPGSPWQHLRHGGPCGSTRPSAAW